VVAGPGGEGIQALDQAVAGTGAIAGHHQPPPERWWQGGNRRGQDLQVISHCVAAGTALAELAGQRLAGVVAVGQQWVMPFSELNDHGVPVSGPVP
jgi:hypothetical protein